MRATLTIAWKDFKQLVSSPMFLLVAGFCTCVWSIVFLRVLNDFVQSSSTPAQFGGKPNLNIHFHVFLGLIQLVNLIFIVAIPAVTMRLLAEEKKMHTFDLLLTVPVSSVNIAVGKFLAGFGVAATLTFISMLYPLGTLFFAEFPLAPLVSSYVGMLLIGGTYVAVGLFASALTQSIMLSMILGVLFNFLLWFVGQISSSDNPIVTAALEHLSVGQNLYSFVKGTYDLSAGVFFLSCMVLFVFLSERVIESSRWR